MDFRWEFGETRKTQSHSWSRLFWASVNWSHKDYNVEGSHFGNYDGDDEFFERYEVNGKSFVFFYVRLLQSLSS